MDLNTNMSTVDPVSQLTKMIWDMKRNSKYLNQNIIDQVQQKIHEPENEEIVQIIKTRHPDAKPKT
jgi:hypothetical protein